MSRRKPPPPIEPRFGLVHLEVAPKVAIVFTAPVHIIPETNQREHWGDKAKRVKAHRAAGKLLTTLALRKVTPTPLMTVAGFLPVDVTLTRIIGPRGRPLDAGDNRPTAFKAVRDGIAEALGVNDGDETRVRWAYSPEERGPQWAIRIRIEKREP